MGADAEILNPTTTREEAVARPCHTRHEFDCGCFANDARLAWMCERHRAETNERRRAAEAKPMGADAETLNHGSIGDAVRARIAASGRDRPEDETQADLKALRQWTPAPALVPPSKWHPIAESIAATVAEKNAAYGDSVTRSADIMRILYPDGIPVDAYKDALLVVRVLDKLSRIATDRDALGESPWRDIAGYALLACERGGE